MKREHFNKHFVKNTRKKALQGNILEFLKFLMETLTRKCRQSGPFFSKIRALFPIFKKGQGRLLLLPLVPRLWEWLNMYWYPWISLNILNIPEYPQECFKKLFWLCQGSGILHFFDRSAEYTSGSKSPKVRIYMLGLCRVLNMSI